MVDEIIEFTTDFSGLPPVFYTLAEDGIHVSQSIEELIRLKGRNAAINPDALKMYLLFQYVPTSESIVKDIYRLPPGCRLSYSAAQGLKIERKWIPVFEPKDDSLEQAAEKIRQAVVCAIEAEKAPKGETGCFLSGGVDSGFLASVLRPEFSFTFAFHDEECDESAQAQQLSDALGAENSCIHISADEFFEAVPAVQRIIGQPYANPSGIAVYYLSELAAQKVHSVFSGEGPDELFGGYENYRVGRNERLYRKLPLILRTFCARLFADCPNRRLAEFLSECASSVEESYIGQAKIMEDREAAALLQPDYASTMLHTDVTAPVFRQIPDGSVLDKKQYLDLNIWGPYDNINSLFLICDHFGLDLRSPYLRENVLETALILKEERRAVGMDTKIAFRKAASAFLPQEICDRPKKSMPLPYCSWFREEKYLELFSKEFSKPYAEKFFHRELLEEMLEKHRKGEENNGRKLYTLYCFLLWYREFFDSADDTEA